MIDSYRIEKCPNSAFYIPNFITEEEEKNLLQNVYDSPKSRWTHLKNRRLQNWGGIPDPKGMIQEKIPDWLNDQCTRIGNLGLFDSKMPNHVLINEYLSGQGIMPHEDGPLYFPTVTTISLGSYTLLDFYKPILDNETDSLDERYMFSLFVEPRSLLVLKDDMYKVYLHGIRESETDHIDPLKIPNFNKITNDYNKDTELKRDTRVSLTIRHVPKIIKANLNSLFFNKKK